MSTATPAQSSSQRRVVVVGGGISGLSAALRLQRAGWAVTVVEARERVGRFLATGMLSGSGPEVDLGAESMLARRPEAVNLAREVGLGSALLHPETHPAAIYSRGALHAMPRTLMGVPTGTEGLLGILSPEEVARVEQAPARVAPVAESDVSLGDWLGAQLGPAVVDRLVEPLLGGVYAGHAARMSLRACVPALWRAACEGVPAAEAARRALAPSTPARAAGPGSNAGAQASPAFAGLRGGVGRLPVAIVKVLMNGGARVATRQRVTKLERRVGKWHIELTPASPRSDAPRSYVEADAVVVAANATDAAPLLGGLAPRAGQMMDTIEYASLALATLVVDGEPTPDEELARLSGLLVPPVEQRFIKAATFASTKWRWVREAFPGRTIVRVSIGRMGDEEGLSLDDAEIARRATADLSDVLDRPLRVVRSRVTRWRHALPQYSVGHAERVAGIRADIRQVPGLAVAGAAYSGVGISACISSGYAAADQVIESLAR